MLKVENVDCWGFEHAIRGMRNPMNSWDKSDSGWGEYTNDLFSFDIGQNDLALMRKLYKAGNEHRKYLRHIFVSLDITAPLYWWKEMDMYKFVFPDPAHYDSNSCSTMHKIADKEFELDDFSHEHLGLICDNGEIQRDCLDTLEMIIDELNAARHFYLKTNDKHCWWQLIQLLPSSYNQKRTIAMSYETVVSIIKQRTGHKLDEWGTLIDSLLELPYVKEIMDV